MLHDVAAVLVVRAALRRQEEHVLILVRHAHAGDKRLWPFSDLERPLSEQGLEQAIGLEQVLGGFPVTRLLTSPARRCRQSLGPLAERLGLMVEEREELARDVSPEVLDEFLARPAVQGAVCCTHGETLSALLRRWRRHKSVLLPKEPTTTPKGASWVIEDGGAGRAAHYLPPLRVLAGSPAPQPAYQLEEEPAPRQAAVG
ncbi:SixA phosphatase family protein [Motilibacter aurantiacus]|uniref:SixA phosphatase family protein n=1 Tax=Motilibacter aurantiacus TaxID=2714955 RepID=UPI001408F16F|nr:phosphoglycerate mutase family protein [Motilibacter aurantiacus]NHC45032.1 histidine phosphatase family protein [Motilibacter aurantiacus]